YRSLAADVQSRVRSGSPGSPDETDAEALAELALEDAKAGRRKEALRGLQLLKTRYAATGAARSKRAEIEAAIGP
ncbi:MAG: hypothetical protein ACYS9X_25370, partial [Planctomycetota bacterium]